LEGPASAVLQSVKSGRTVECLREAAEGSGKDATQFLGDHRFERAWPYCVRFHHTDGRVYLVAMLQARLGGWERSIGFFLFSLDGKALDYVHVETNNILVGITGTFLTQEAPDGAVIRLDLDVGGYSYIAADQNIGYVLCFDDGRPRRQIGTFTNPLKPEQERVGRIAIRHGKFHILEPSISKTR